VSGLVFLLVALLLSVIGSAVLWFTHRKPTSLDHGITSFEREMRALSPDRRQHQRRGGDS
jgi:hypothetical protein